MIKTKFEYHYFVPEIKKIKIAIQTSNGIMLFRGIYDLHTEYMEYVPTY